MYVWEVYISFGELFIQLIIGNKASMEFNIPWAHLLLVLTAVLIRLQSKLLVTTSREYRHKCFLKMYNSGKIATLFSHMVYAMVMGQMARVNSFVASCQLFRIYCK